MTIRLDIEANYSYQRTISAIHTLKAFHDVGVDVKKHAKSFSLHTAGSYGFAYSDLIILFDLLAPHVLSNCTFLASYINDEHINEKKREIVDCMNITDEEEKKMFFDECNTFYEYALYHYKGDFSGVDFNEAQRAAYPFLNDYAHCLNSDYLEFYKKHTKMPESKHQITEDDGYTSYIYFNYDKTEFLIIIDMSSYSDSIDRLVGALTNIQAQVLRNA